jgi:hypothetical protein
MRFKMHKIGVAAFLAVFFLCAGLSYALDVTIEPSSAHREINGKVRVHIYATGAVDLISFGVKVTFNPAVLQVVDAKKFTDFSSGWLMDADGNSITTSDQYTTPSPVIDNGNGSVTMIGGRLIGTSTNGLNGKVLLGWIVFTATNNGKSDIAVSVAKPSPFDNFVRLQGIVEDSQIVPGNRASICIIANACYADLDGDNDVDMSDSLKFRQANPSTFPAANYNPAADFDADGDVDMSDSLKFRNGSPRNGCPSCS